MRVTWVHPSWRDLVVEHLATDRQARRDFLASCELHGAQLALSTAGGAAGERTLPLLVDDADWDTFADNVHRLCRDLGHDDVARLLGAIDTALDSDPYNVELDSLAELALATTRRRFAHEARPLTPGLAEAWLRLADIVAAAPEPPDLRATWDASVPRPGDAATGRLRDWRALVSVLREYAPDFLREVGYPERYRGWILAGDEMLVDRWDPAVPRSPVPGRSP